MIRKLTLSELIEAATSLAKSEQAILIAAMESQTPGLAQAAQTPPRDEFFNAWASLSIHGLAQVYGDDEPMYSEADLVPTVISSKAG